MNRAWSKEPPTEPGCYFVRHKRSEAWAETYYTNRHGKVVDAHDDPPGYDRLITPEWLGPITPDDVFAADGWYWLGECANPNHRADPCDARVLSGTVSRPLTFTAARARAQHHADAEVGRMLREIVEAGCDCIDVEFGDAGAVVVIDCYRRTNPESRLLKTGPDALERAHREVCGGGGDGG